MSKYKLIIIISMFLVITSISRVYAFVNGYSLLGKVIYLDPGHGGVDSGAIYKNIKEKDLNLVISKKIEKELIAKGAIVYLTRDDDKDLSLTTVNRKRSDLINRAYLINKINPDIYLSIHLNYMDNSSWKGLQIFYNSKNEENEVIATVLTDYLSKRMSNVREIKRDNTYYMYKHIASPGVLIELGFLSNPDDRYRLTHNEYVDKLVSDLVCGIEFYFSNL